ncbi:MAG: Ig-like domain-containing protein [Gemmatimonadales bacterium]
MTAPKLLVLASLAGLLAGCGGSSPTSPQCQVSAVSVNAGAGTVPVGGTLNVQANISQQNCSGLQTAWASDNQPVATVSSAGVVTGVTAGQANITATVSGVHGSAQITVTPAACQVSAVTVSPAAATVFVNQTTPLTATITQQNCTGLSPTWSSLAQSVATVAVNGIVTGVTPGTTKVRATVNGVIGEADITVEIAPLGATWTETRLAIAGTGTVPGGFINAMWAASPTDLFVVSDFRHFRYNGTTWTGDPDGYLPLYGIWGSSPTNVLGVGLQMRRWDGTTWTTLTAPSSNTYRAVWGSGPTAAMAVGDGGAIASWNGTAWSAMTSPTASALYGISGSGGTFAVAVGDGGKILHYNGTSWAAVTSPTTSPLFAVWVASPTAAVAVGFNGTVVKWDGATWELVTQFTSARLNAVWGASPTDLYVAGSEGFLAHFSGTAWTQITSRSPEDYTAITGAGGATFAGGDPVISLTPTSTTLLAYTPTLHGVAAVDDDHAYAVGNGGIIWKYTNGTWQSIAAGDNLVLNAVWASAQDQVYVAGREGNAGVILHYNGTTVTRMTIPASASLIGLAGPAPNGLIAISRFSPILRFDGATWSAATAGAPGDPNAVASVSATNYLLVGGAGFAAKYDGGSTVTNAPAPATEHFLSVWGSSPTNYLAGTNNGKLWRFDGTSWTQETIPSSAIARGFWSASGTITMVSGTGEVLRKTGTTWTRVRQGGGVERFLSAAASPALGRAWLVGAAGAVQMTP